MSNHISGKSKVYGIIGDPVEQSISPTVHNAAFKKMGIDSIYVPLLVKSENLPQAIASMKALNLMGLNVTIPHKINVIPLLDKLDAVAQEIGAVNTIVNRNGNLEGYNTDGAGFIKALSINGIAVENKNVIIIGAGGTARAISFALAEKGASLTIINRTVTKALELVKSFSSHHNWKLNVLEFNTRNLLSAIKDADILINATNIGMGNYQDISLVNATSLKSKMVVCDVIYNPGKTRLLQAAELNGARIVNGMEMFIQQAALSFEKWTGVKAPIEIMREEALNALKTV
jgi:shikimate dehydrogenase